MSRSTSAASDSSEEYFGAVHRADTVADPRLFAVNTGTVDSEGGFSVPSQVFAGLFNDARWKT